MPMPHSYRVASREWRAILDDVRDVTGLETDNLAYTAIQGALLAFRRRLTVDQALRFADVLPAVPRAIFVADWVPASPLPFGARPDWTREIMALRPHHNLTPDHALPAVARALWRVIRHDHFHAALARMPEGAVDYWSVPGADPADLATRFV